MTCAPLSLPLADQLRRCATRTPETTVISKLPDTFSRSGMAWSTPFFHNRWTSTCMSDTAQASSVLGQLLGDATHHGLRCKHGTVDALEVRVVAKVWRNTVFKAHQSVAEGR